MAPKSLIVEFKTFFGYYYYYYFRPVRVFMFQGKSYFYLHRKYNATWRNERAVEVPICWQVVQAFSGKRILEVGNVLSHYFPIQHEVVDKYEHAPYVINQDVIDFKPARLYDLIVSISTLEHVGWDETPKDSTKIPQVMEHLTNLLADAGQLIITVPLGYNPFLDALLREDRIPFTKQCLMQKISKPSLWAEVEWDSIKATWPDYTNSTASAILIGYIENAYRA